MKAGMGAGAAVGGAAHVAYPDTGAGNVDGKADSGPAGTAAAAGACAGIGVAAGIAGGAPNGVAAAAGLGNMGVAAAATATAGLAACPFVRPASLSAANAAAAAPPCTSRTGNRSSTPASASSLRFDLTLVSPSPPAPLASPFPSFARLSDAISSAACCTPLTSPRSAAAPAPTAGVTAFTLA